MSWVQQQPQQQPPATIASALSNSNQMQHTSSAATNSGGIAMGSTLDMTQQQSIHPNTQNNTNLNNNQPAHQQLWPQQNYLQQQNSTIMQPLQATPSPYSGVTSNKRQQQQPQHNVPIKANANAYHQQNANVNNWQQSEMVPIPTQQQQQANNYGGYFAQQQQPAQENNFIQQQQQQYIADTTFANYQQPAATKTQPPPQQQIMSNAQQDSWTDWDWNDNSNNNIQLIPDQKQEEPLMPPQAHYKAPNIIAESFNAETNDNNWQWNIDENNKQQQQEHKNVEHLPHQQIFSNIPVDAPPPAQFYSQPQVPTVVAQVPQPLQKQQPQSLDNTSKYAAVQAVTKPNSLPLAPAAIDIHATSNSSHVPVAEVSNDESNKIASAPVTTATTSIPSPVYVSQAKPVSKPPRQFASPPGVTPTEVPEASPLLPPHAFQNETPAMEPNLILPSSATATPTVSQTQTAQKQFSQMAAIENPPSLSSAVIQPPPPQALNPPFPLQPLVGGNNNTVVAGNPFKRTGTAQHHRSGIIQAAAPTQMIQPINPTNYVVPPPPADFANPIQQNLTEISETGNSEIVHENQEVISITTAQNVTLPGGGTLLTNTIMATQLPLPPPPNDERNQYLQTSHLSENPDEELNAEADNFPPPGLSRLVLGQPELEASQRMVTGTEVPINMGNLNIDERQADGEDTTLELPTAITMTSANSENNIDITADRNLYLVAGESMAGNEQRVVTGVERIENPTPNQVINEQREIELDGENLEDQQQMQQQQPINTVINRNEPPLEGAAANSEPNTLTATTSNPADSYTTKDLSNISTGNDESDQINDHRAYNLSKSRRKNEVLHEKNQEKQRKEKQRLSANRYESEDSPEYQSDHDRDRRRNYREGSVRSEHDKERDLLEKKRRENRGGNYANDRERARGEKHYYRVEGGERIASGDIERRPERRSQRHHRYPDDLKYETEESIRKERARNERERVDRNERDRGGDRTERDRGDRSEYDDYRRYHQSSKRDGKRDIEDRKRRDVYADESDKRRRGGGGSSKGYRDEYDTLERRNRREKHRTHDAREYEDYRKQSSRNGRNESDLDKEQRRDPRYDARHAGMYGYPPAAYGYDPYAYYYEQMARNNPQAYAEWYKKYYGHALERSGENLMTNSASATDGRESVHSGRSSANNLKDRYTHAYISQANEYHRHFLHQQQQLAANMSHKMNSTMMLEESATSSATQSNQYPYVYGLSGGRSTGNLSQIHLNSAGYYAVPGTAGNTDVAYYPRSEYADSRSGDVDPIPSDPQRLTPCKFVNDHAVVSFSAGLLITVKPKYTPNGVSNVVKLLRLGANDSTRQLLQSFPGPLVRGLTHKKTIIEFCEEQIRFGPINTTIYAKQLLPSSVEKYKASYTLMWNLLILLLRQNGMVVGTDIAELLLKNQSQFPYVARSSQTPNLTASNSINSKADSDSIEDNDNDSKGSGDENIDVAAVDSNNAADSPTSSSAAANAASAANVPSEGEVTAKFRNYLIYGNVNEALDWATDNNLWGHALFLASKMDRRSHANVMMKFANKLSLNDPLQTLYQLMSGRTPSSVTSVQDEKWGDWRPHLSMILSNTSQKPELDRRAITTLGDSLFNRGDLYAAHFCYLMAQVSFGRYQESATQETTLQQCLPKLVLLGSSHYKSFKEFATNESIMMTEIYEYACSLNDDKFSLIEFQPYKYLFATRLLDYGYQLKALMYMEQISLHIQHDPSKFEPSFINKVYEFADRLKFYDPALEKIADDPQNADSNFNNSIQHNIEDQKWLQMLRGLAAKNQVDETSNATYMNSVADAQNQNYQNQIDQQFAEINKQFSELNRQYNNNIESNDLTNQQQQEPHAVSENIDAIPQAQHVQPAVTTSNLYDASLYAPEQQQQNTYSHNAHTEANELVNTQNNYAGYDQQYLSSQQESNQQSTQSAYYDPTQQLQQQYNAAEYDAQPGGAYDYWNSQTQSHQQSQESEVNAPPMISMPNTKKSYEKDASEQQQQGLNADVDRTKKSNSESKDNSKNSQLSSSNQNSGWFGGIWNKLSLKPKNQMILPDDKNPSIVWDAEKKRWVNTNDGDEAAEDPLKPPPKMADLVSQLQQQQQQAPTQLQRQKPQQIQATPVNLSQMQQQRQMPIPLHSPFEHNQYSSNLQSQQHSMAPPAAATITAPSVPNAASATQHQSYSAIGANVGNAPAALEPTKPPSLQSNMFKMQRNRTLKNSYVDVFNPSGAPMSKAAESVLAPAPPPAMIQSGFFIPAPVPTNSDGTGTYQQGVQQQEMSQDLPQFYNPNQFSGASGSH